MDLKDRMQIALSAVRVAKEELELCNSKFDSLSDYTEEGKRQLYPGSGELDDLADDIDDESRELRTLASVLLADVTERSHLCCIEGTC